MTRFFQLNPEVPGGLGEHTVMDRSVHPPAVSSLHYEFADWLGDCLIQSSPCFLILEDVAATLAGLGTTGATTCPAELTAGDGWSFFQPGVPLPRFVWLQVSGVPLHDDFGLSSSRALIVSERVFVVLEEHGLLSCASTAL